MNNEPYQQVETNGSRGFVVMVGILCLAILAYFIVSSLVTVHSTGTLKVYDPIKSDSLSIRPGVTFQAKPVSGDLVGLRLKPGSYQLLDSFGQITSITGFAIYKNKTTSLTVSSTQKNKVIENKAPAINKIFSILPYTTNLYSLYARPSSDGSDIPEVIFNYVNPLVIPSYDPTPSVPQNGSDQQASIVAAKNWLLQQGVTPEEYNFVINDAE